MDSSSGIIPRIMWDWLYTAPSFVHCFASEWRAAIGMGTTWATRDGSYWWVSIYRSWGLEYKVVALDRWSMQRSIKFWWHLGALVMSVIFHQRCYPLVRHEDTIDGLSRTIVVWLYACTVLYVVQYPDVLQYIHTYIPDPRYQICVHYIGEVSCYIFFFFFCSPFSTLFSLQFMYAGTYISLYCQVHITETHLSDARWLSAELKFHFYPSTFFPVLRSFGNSAASPGDLFYIG